MSLRDLRTRKGRAVKSHPGAPNTGTDDGDDGIYWGMPLQFFLPGSSRPFKGTLVGIDEGSLLICTVPDLDSQSVKTPGEKRAAVRYLHSGAYFGFTYKILSIIGEPLPLILLAYPDEIYTARLRQNERISCRIPALLKMGSISFKGVVLDLSVTGCCFAMDLDREKELPESPAGGTAILVLQMEETRTAEIMEVVPVHMRKEDDKVKLGMRFKDESRNGLSLSLLWDHFHTGPGPG